MRSPTPPSSRARQNAVRASVLTAALIAAALATPRETRAQTLTFGTDQLVTASEFAARNERPRVEVTQDGNAQLIWVSGPFGSEDLFLVTSPPGGTYGAAQPLNTTPGIGVDAGAGPTLRTRGDYLVAGFENHNSGIFAARSTDMGATWELPIRADSQSPETRYLQAVGIFPNGRMSQSWLAFAGGGLNDPGVAWTVQDDQGDFIPAIEATAVSPEEGCVCCNPDQLVLDDGQTVLVAFRNNEHNIREIHVLRSTDGGATFPEDIRVDTTGWTVLGCPSTGPHMAADGNTVLISWKSAANDEAHIWLSRSVDAGATWSPIQQIDQTDGTTLINSPQVAIRGSLAVTVWEATNTESRPAIFARASTDAGVTWGPRVQVNDPAENFILRGHPTAAIFHDSVVEVAWKDLRLGTYRIFHARGTVSSVGMSAPAPPALGTLQMATRPNPVGASTRFTFDLPRDGFARLTIIDTLGRQRALVTSGTLAAGPHAVPWDGRDAIGRRLPPGVYFAHLIVAGVSRGADKVLITR